jgi:ABC-type glycerol-3-phosphate transport system substrate-binding protein
MPATEKQEVAAAAKKVVVMTVIPGPAGTAIQGNAEAFMKERPDVEIKVNVAGGAETEYKPNFPPIAVSVDRPDLAWYWVDGRQYQDLVAAGALEALADLYIREGWDKALPEAVLTKYLSPDGHRYAVAQDVVVYPQILPEIKPAFLLYAGDGLMMLKDPDNRDAAEADPTE